MNSVEIKQLILSRRKRYETGLAGRYEAIARWLFKNHNIVTTDVYICQVIKGEQSKWKH